jgi:DNA (cytosine-5)-methyltransferase 1
MMERIKLFELFSGYGGGSFALKKAGIPFECVGYSEVDPKCSKCKKITPHSIVGLNMICDRCGSTRINYVAQCYDQNHQGIKNYGDITKIVPEELPDFDLMTGGFPCQSFSIAGKGLGELDPRGTLFYEIIRIAEVKKPKIMVLENVKGLTSKKHKATFDKILSELKRIGYDVKWKVLNSKEHGIPQNRERVWFVCKLGLWELDWFKFPEKEELKIFIKDILEEQVDEKYYLKPHQVAKIEEALKKKLEKKQVSDCLKVKGTHSKDMRNWDYIQEPNIFALRSYPRTGKDDKDRFQNPELRDDGCSNSLTSVEKDNYVIVHNTQTRSEKRPSIVNKTSSGGSGHICKKDGTTYCLDTGNNQCIEIKDCVIQHREQSKEVRIYDGINPTISSSYGTGGGNVPYVLNQTTNIFHRLTPRECMRLMGFLKDEIKMEGISDSQLYKLAGNGWEISVVSKIFKEMFK